MKALKRQAEEELEEKKRRALANQQYLKEAQLKAEKKPARQDTSNRSEKSRSRTHAKSRRASTRDSKNFKQQAEPLRQD